MDADLTDFEGDELESGAERRSQQTPQRPSRRANRPVFGRRQKAPSQINGIHRRRRKRVRW